MVACLAVAALRVSAVADFHPLTSAPLQGPALLPPVSTGSSSSGSPPGPCSAWTGWHLSASAHPGAAASI